MYMSLKCFWALCCVAELPLVGFEPFVKMHRAGSFVSSLHRSSSLCLSNSKACPCHGLPRNSDVRKTGPGQVPGDGTLGLDRCTELCVTTTAELPPGTQIHSCGIELGPEVTEGDGVSKCAAGWKQI